MKTSKIVNFLTIMVLLFAAGCSLFEREPSKTVADWGEIEQPAPPIEVEKEDIFKEYHVTYTTTPTDSSYWYVIIQIKNPEGSDYTWTNYHGTVALPMPYFDFYEARKEFKEGESYWKFIEPLTKEGYESFDKYKENK